MFEGDRAVYYFFLFFGGNVKISALYYKIRHTLKREMDKLAPTNAPFLSAYWRECLKGRAEQVHTILFLTDVISSS